MKRFKAVRKKQCSNEVVSTPLAYYKTILLFLKKWWPRFFLWCSKTLMLQNKIYLVTSKSNCKDKLAKDIQFDGKQSPNSVGPASSVYSPICFSYLIKLSEFLKLFVSLHFKRLEAEPEFDAIEFLSYLFQYTFQVKLKYFSR